jgi:hypothetical protein
MHKPQYQLSTNNNQQLPTIPTPTNNYQQSTINHQLANINYTLPTNPNCQQYLPQSTTATNQASTINYPQLSTTNNCQQYQQQSTTTNNTYNNQQLSAINYQPSTIHNQ